MITYIRQNPSAVFGVHQHLTQVPYPQHRNAPIESSTPQTPKRILDASDSDGAQISKQQRIFSNEKQKKPGHINMSMATNSVNLINRSPVLDQPRQQASEQ
ncbi:unnamed protein product [Rotaria sordida]|uniref:Uncharacterized protein n=2 Tax=Rotaria sordida TaxID=392033 RepID=A0A819XIY8_9BILA|nr:unnamed protein product [Rotaria sordida]CAF4142799.1 unnamed protein product [Rotaria sordida]